MPRPLPEIRSLVVKLGTQLLSRPDRTLNTEFLGDIARQIALLRAEGLRVTVVSSGAVGAGLAALRLPKRPGTRSPQDLAVLQAVAAVGQPRLMTAWAEALAPHGLAAAQILLTREDIDHRIRYLNLRNTLAAAERLGAVPILNENDSVSTDEMVRISFGENDLLAALVTHAIQADLLVLLSVVDGVLDAAGQPIRTVNTPAEVKSLVRNEKTAGGKGGMDAKLAAAQLVTSAGSPLIIADGRTPDVLPRLLAGEELGTYFLSRAATHARGTAPDPVARPPRGKSRWLMTARPRGQLTVDDGAAKALGRGDRSLLPAGITAVHGTFLRGDVVEVLDPAGQPIARGLTNYPSTDIPQIQGKKTQEIRHMLTGPFYEEVIHRDNLILLRGVTSAAAEGR